MSEQKRERKRERKRESEKERARETHILEQKVKKLTDRKTRRFVSAFRIVLKFIERVTRRRKRKRGE